MKRSMLLVCAVTLAGLLGQPASARDREHQRDRDQDDRPKREQREPREHRQRDGHRSSPEMAARLAQQQNGGGRVLSVDRDGDGYRVKLLKDGEVRSYFITTE